MNNAGLSPYQRITTVGQAGIRSLAELIQQQAAASPDAIAVYGSQTARGMTYRQLQTQLGDVRRCLRQAGIQQDDRVAVVLPNGPEMATAFLSVAAACVCAPLNPNFRESEFQFYLSDLGIKALVLTDGERGAARTAAQTLGIPVLELSLAHSGPIGSFTLHGTTIGREVPDREAEPEDIALVLHTSGTTAKPKIVPLSHRNLCASAENIRRTLQLKSADRCLNVMPLFHIHGLIGALLSSISAGASVACCPPFDADRFLAWWESIDPTWYTAVPTIHQAVLAQIERKGRPPAHASLRLVRSSSSSLPPSVMQRLEEAFGVPVLESYGMTEAAHQMASNPLPPLPRKPGSVGVAAGPEMAIMNEAGELLPTGATGEIVIRGENVTAGYANNPGANAASFTHGWFRTGDQGWQDDDGYFWITGRLKELINRGGEKVAPREVDDALLDLPGVAQAVTFAVPHPRLGEDVVAAVVLRPGCVITERELRQQALSRLTAVKMPSRIVFVDEIPKGGTGKVQRIGLHEKLQHLLVAEFVEPSSDAELALSKLWHELFDQEQIGMHDNFFSRGGDSLLAGRLVVRIADAFGVDFSLPDLFEAPTIGEQAVRIEQKLIDQITGSEE